MGWGKNVGDGCVTEDNRLGANFRIARLALNISQEQLAAEVGVSRSCISKAERCGNVSLGNFGRIALQLGVQPVDLMKGVTCEELIKAEGKM